ncbi:hypothetical protein MAP00_008607 [Monascus purpureus]|nr:hypothetical protein MAP00_008607 [Monascus purpureus]
MSCFPRSFRLLNRAVIRPALSSPRLPVCLCGARWFSSSKPGRIMEMSCFSSEQLMVRDAISKICSKFSEEYWVDYDESGEYPHELHAALAKDGWIGIALPEELGGAGLGISEATMVLQTIAQCVIHEAEQA